MLIPLILSGGSGTRLWPLSREMYPKQLLPLIGKRTMLQETAARVSGLPDLAAPIVVCNESHRFMVAEQMREHGTTPQAIILEPVGRNTAPAVAVAALVALDRAHKNKAGNDADPILLVLPADHVIRDVAAFQAAVVSGSVAAAAGKLVTFGVVPDRAETGYGYIRRASGDGPTYPVQQFVEKPDAERAAAYLASGEFRWNAGMFVVRASVLLELLEQWHPTMVEGVRALAADSERLDEVWPTLTKIAIDHAVAEPAAAAGRVAVVPATFGWDDIGDFDSLDAAAVEETRRRGARLVRHPVRKDRTDGELAVDEALDAGRAVVRDVTPGQSGLALLSPYVRLERVLLVPVQAPDRDVGVVVLNRPHASGEFSDEQIDFVEGSAKYVGVAIENVRLMLDARARRHDLELVRDSSLDFAQSVDMNEVLGPSSRGSSMRSGWRRWNCVSRSIPATGSPRSRCTRRWRRSTIRKYRSIS